VKKTLLDRLRHAWVAEHFDLSDSFAILPDGSIRTQRNEDREKWINGDTDCRRPRKINATDTIFAARGIWKLSLRPCRQNPATPNRQ